MLNNILNLVKDTVSGALTNNNNIPADKKDKAIETTTHALTEGLKDNINLGNISNITDLFKNGTSTSSNPVVSSITSTVANALVQKVGLSQGISNTIASTVVPMVMKVISGKVNDPNEKGFDAQSIIDTFSGGNLDSNSIIGAVGKLFGR